MAYYDTLKALWATLPSGDTTAQKLAAVQAMTIAAQNAPVQIAAVMTYLRANNLWLPIKAAALAGTSQGAIAALDLNQDLRITTIDFSLPIVQAMLADLVSHGLLSQALATALAALGTPPIAWWQANGYTSPISQGDLDAAGGLS